MNVFQKLSRRMPLSFRLQKRVFLPALALLLVTALIVHVADAWWTQRSEGTPPELIPGPWGDLQTWDIRLEQPVEYSGFETAAPEGSCWNFGTVSPDAVRSAMLSAGLDSADADHLLKDCRVPNLNVLAIKPDTMTLLGIKPEARSVLYRSLAEIPGNRFQSIPYYVPGNDPASLLANDSKFSDRVLPVMRKLCYNRNGFTYFSDPEAVLSLLSSGDERRVNSCVTSRVSMLFLCGFL